MQIDAASLLIVIIHPGAIRVTPIQNCGTVAITNRGEAMMRVFLIAMFVGGMSLAIGGGGWWNKLQAKAAETPVSEMMPQVIGAELALLVGMLTALTAGGALVVGRAAQEQERPSGDCLDKMLTTRFKMRGIQAALEEGQGIRETASLVEVAAATVARGQADVRTPTPLIIRGDEGVGRRGRPYPRDQRDIANPDFLR
jgi:hypothetical protein